MNYANTSNKMELQELLKQFKNIGPDAGYTRRSRSLIVEAPMPERPLLSPWRIFTHSLQLGSTIALVGVLLVLVLGGFSSWKFLSPFRLSSLDPSSLQAEAQAIDIQVHLTDINYVEPENQTTTAKTSADTKAKQAAEKEARSLGLTFASSSEPLTIDGVLERLSQ